MSRAPVASGNALSRVLQTIAIGVLIVGPLFALEAKAQTVKIFVGSLQTGQANIISGIYDGTTGVTSSVSTGVIDAASLAGVDLAIGWLRNSYSAAESAALASHLGAGGRILFAGEHGGFSPSQNIAINGALAILGSSMSLDNTILDGGFQLATVANGQVLSHPLTTGVASFEYGAPSGITGGDALLVTTDLATPFAATETLGSGLVAVIGDSNITDTSGSNDNDVFFLNLAQFDFEPTPSVGIDILPGVTPNFLDPSLNQKFEVVIFGELDFDVADIVISSLAFGPAEGPVFGWAGTSISDVDADGEDDLSVFFRIEESGIQVGDTSACLTGETLSEDVFEGCDSITTTAGGGGGAVPEPGEVWMLLAGVLALGALARLRARNATPR